MKNKTKGLLIAASILVLTLGVLIVRTGLGTPAGLYWASTLDVILAAPLLPFLTLVWFYPNVSPGNMFTIVATISVIFWLLVGYLIGTWMDKRKK